MKECIVCNKEFTVNSNVQKYCSKDCWNVILKEKLKTYKQKEQYKSMNKERQKRYRKTDKYKISHLNAVKKYRKTEGYRIVDKKWSHTIKGRINYWKKCKKRRAAENNITEIFSIDDWTAMKDKTKGICPCCKRDVGLANITLDHIYSVSLASLDFLRTGIKRVYTINDIQPLCFGCNASKGNRIITKPKGL